MHIVGVSFDLPETTMKWVENQQFPFEVWTDTDRALALAYGAAAGPEDARPKRISVLLDAQGELLRTYGDVSVQAHPADVLEDVTRIYGPN